MSIALIDGLVMLFFHSLWQAAIVAALLWMILRWVSATLASVRYALTLLALGLIIMSMVTTWSVLELGQHGSLGQYGSAVTVSESPVPQDGEPALTNASSTNASSTNASSQDASLPNDAQGNLANNNSRVPQGLVAAPRTGAVGVGVPTTTWAYWIVVVWGGGASLMLFRVAWFVANTRGLVIRSHPLDDSRFVEVVDQIKRQLGIGRRVRVMVCDRVDVPAVLGLFWPILLVPTSMLTGLPMHQIRVIVAHELAHVRRFDYVVNLCQMLVESVLFYNPVVWWISRQIRVEREACCDALAVALTGTPMDVATTLVDVAEELDLRQARDRFLAQAIGDDSGSLLSRVQRIVMPNRYPQIRLPWLSLIAITCICSAMTIGLERGTRTAVVAAAHWFQEDKQELPELYKEYGEQPRRSESYSDDEKIRLVVNVSMSDGSAVPKQIRVSARTQYRRGAAEYSLIGDDSQRFEANVDPGTIFVRATCKGFAAAVAEPIQCKPSEKIDEIELTMHPGFTAELRLVDSDGNGIAGAKIDGGFLHEKYSVDSRSLVTDRRGVARVMHCPKLPFRMDLEAAGFQYERQTIDVRADAATDIELRHARLTKGRVLNAETGEPIEGATIDLVSQFGNSELVRTYTPFNQNRPTPRLTQTDKTGHFAIDRFRDDCKYALLVAAVGRAPQLIQPIESGQKNIQIELGPPRTIRGTIVGPLDALRNRRDKNRSWRSFTFHNSATIGDMQHSYSREVEVEIRDGVGHFIITNLLPGPISTRLGGKTYRFDPDPTLDDAKIDLTPDDPEPIVKRTVIIRLQVPRGGAPATGALEVAYIGPGYAPSSYSTHRHSIENNRVQFEVPVPTRIAYSTGQLLGYYVKDKSIDVKAGDGTLVIDVPAIPAGAIYGRVLEADGTPCEKFRVEVIVVERPPELNGVPNSIGGDEGRSGKFLVSALPLGGRYRLVASLSTPDSEAKVVSEEFHLTRDNAIHETYLRFLDGVTVSGQVLTPGGKPVPGASIALEWSSPYSHGFGGAARTTDRHGDFQIHRVNPKLRGEFRLVIAPTESLQGRTLEFSPSEKPLAITLRQGVRSAGVLLDDATGQPIPHARIDVFPALGVEPKYRGEITTKTDSKGEFAYSNLEPIRYRLRIDGAVHPNVRIETLPDGRTRFHYDVEPNQWEIDGGESDSLVLRVKLRPNSKLKPIP